MKMWMHKKVILICLMVINITWAASASCDADSMENRARNFIDGMGKKVIGILEDYQKKKISNKEKNQQLREIIVQSVDFKRVGLSAIGKYRRQVPRETIARYLKAFEKAVTRTYLNKFGEYNDDNLVVVAAFSTDIGRSKGVIVKSELRRKNGPKVTLVWVVIERNHEMVIIDLKVEGASMLRTYQQEYLGIIGSGKNPKEGMKMLTDNLENNNTKWDNPS